MSDLTVSGGGIGRVSTEAMTLHATGLRSFADGVESLRARVFYAQALTSWPLLTLTGAPAAAHQAGSHLNSGHMTLGLAHLQAQSLAGALDLAADGYGMAERMNEQLMTHLFGQMAYGLGLAHPVVISWFGAAAGFGALGWTMSSSEGRQLMMDALVQQKAALSDPRFVDLVRLAVMSVDEFGAGVIRVPLPLMPLLGDEALGVLGLTSSASFLGALTVARAETPVTVSKTSTAAVVPPTGIADRVSRVPMGSEQVLVERYDLPDGSTHVELYISGTRDGALSGSTEPFDMTSNVMAMGMGDAGSLRAVEQALTEAGVTAEDTINITGYSQGGMVGAVVAGSGEWNVQSLVTVGAPTGQLPIPDSVAYLAIEHEEDLVPALGGNREDLDTVVVTRRVFPDGDIPDSSLLPAHDFDRYQQTAELVDDSADARVADVLDRMAGSTAGVASGEATAWFAERVKVTDDVEIPLCRPA